MVFSKTDENIPLILEVEDLVYLCRMKTRYKCKFIFLIISLIAVIEPLIAAHDINQWRSRTAQIAADTSLTDSLKVIRLSDLTYNYYYYYRTFDYRNLDEYLQQAERFIGNEYQNDLLSYIYGTAIVIAKDDQIIPIKEKCENYTRKSINPLIRAQGWERLGRKYITSATGLDYFSRALDAVEGTVLYVAQSSINQYIAVYYSMQGDAKNAMKYAVRSLELARQSDNPREQINAWESIAEAHSSLLEYPAAIEAYAKARVIYLENRKTPDPDPDLHYRDELHYMVMLVNLGSMYYNKGDLHTAVRIITEALETATHHSFVETQAYCHNELGNIHIALKQYPVAETYLLSAVDLLATDYIKTLESDYIDCDVHLALAQLYELTGNYRKSAGYYHEGIRKYRHLNDEERTAANQQYAATYETRMQEETIDRMETIVNYHERRRLLYAAILIVTLIAFYVVARLYRTRINLAQQKENNLHAQARLLKLNKSKAELDNRLKQQEADALKQKLALGNKLLEDCNRSFDNLTSFFNRHPELGQYQMEVKNIIYRQTRIDNNIEEYKQGFAGVPLDFYDSLQKIADNKLTPLDLKYCRLLYLETSTKEIAELLSVEPKTVRMTKYRLKQKMKLDKENDLSDFIRNISK